MRTEPYPKVEGASQPNNEHYVGGVKELHEVHVRSLGSGVSFIKVDGFDWPEKPHRKPNLFSRLKRFLGTN